MSQKIKPAQITDSITSKIPSSATLTSVSVSDGAALISGVSGDESGIAQFIANLKNDDTFKSVNLTEVNSSQDNPNQTNFEISATY
jgi:Tfp pilus assembly protein PilN